MTIPAPTEYPSDSDVESLFMPRDAGRIRENGFLGLWRRVPRSGERNVQLAFNLKETR